MLGVAPTSLPPGAPQVVEQRGAAGPRSFVSRAGPVSGFINVCRYLQGGVAVLGAYTAPGLGLALGPGSRYCCWGS